MIFNLLDLQITSAHRVYYIDILSAETEDSDMADGLYSLFHLACVDGEWYFDFLWLKQPLRWLLSKFFC